MREIKASDIEFRNNFLYIENCFVRNAQGYENVSDMRQEIATLYIIAESGFGNSAALTLVAAFDEGEAVHAASVEVLENVCSIEEIHIK